MIMNSVQDIHCQHFVQRKNRFCRMTVKPHESYCGEHKPTTFSATNVVENDVNASTDRIQCPLDNTHTCYKSRLSQHLKKCNAGKEPSLPYIKKDYNRVEVKNVMKRSLMQYSHSDIVEVIKKVNQVYNKHISGSITSVDTTHDILKDEIECPQYGKTTLKHLLQTSSLIGILDLYNLLQPETCYVEFGAGKGKLSFWLAKSISNLSNSSVLLIEKASLRHKLDNKLEKGKDLVYRIRADIADVVLENIDMVTKRKQVVGVTKHLCGEATDLAIKCLIAAKKEKPVLGALLSFCCHHQCQWESYVGKNFFKNVGLSHGDFEIMCGLVSWAVCGTGKSRGNQSKENLNSEGALNISLSEMKNIGFKCKHIIDWGRKCYLDELSFYSVLHYYVNPNVTLENVCIVAINEELKK
ncbi:tRNA:m(4)X modification enzyme TRM13 homolog isoform X2 [Agrilus planipennis]|uniref:tRNA:m(4)X modification enzyme TRM13 n=1 Tax=Agrilus planipennis TaxID=224129 RepID=A0A1W4WS31_AGRPL|nr:tRNA:m(4)X modification enzyme TRM13 homolog isoform X2 [Agrilus planipennis]